jgi:hypothetical protein
MDPVVEGLDVLGFVTFSELLRHTARAGVHSLMEDPVAISGIQRGRGKVLAGTASPPSIRTAVAGAAIGNEGEVFEGKLIQAAIVSGAALGDGSVRYGGRHDGES